MKSHSMNRITQIALWLLWCAVVIPVGFAQVTPARQASVFPRQPATGYTTGCKIVRVIDGDTVAVEVTQTFHVRLLQCWAPESRTTDKTEKAKGLASKEHMQSLVDEEDQATLFVPLSGDLTDAMTLGRVLGYLWRKGDTVSVNQMQVDEGFAVPIDPKGRH